VDRGEDVTAGDLARLTGLTTGAITAAIDRLEKAGLARRERSETDRRKVFIRRCHSSAMARIAPFYEALGRESMQLAARYSTSQLETIKGLLRTLQRYYAPPNRSRAPFDKGMTLAFKA
jgi:DNA-binding GntR family transcriptional regulator